MPFASVDNLHFDYVTTSQSDAAKKYVVSWGANLYDQGLSNHTGTRDWSCTCPDWSFHRKRKGGYCKHIQAVKSLDPAHGGPCFWTESYNDPVVMLPRYVDVFAVNIAGYMHMNWRLWNPGWFLTAITFMLKNCQPYAPYIDEDGDPIPAVYVPDLRRRIMQYDRGDKTITVIYLPLPDLALVADDDTTRIASVSNVAAKPEPVDPAICSDCGEPMVFKHDDDPDEEGFICANPACFRSPLYVNPTPVKRGLLPGLPPK